MALRFLTAGESHGPELSVILEGFPAGLRIDREVVNKEMARRQKGFGSGGRMKIERDRISITAGIMANHSTGGPISIRIPNLDYVKWKEKEVEPMTIPRPGHADLTGAIKYGYQELRLSLERASARETAARVAAGAICKQLLTAFDITVGSYVISIGQAVADVPKGMDYVERFAAAERNEVRCPDPRAVKAMEQQINQIMQDKDTLGGVFEVVALGIPAGLGSYVHWDRRLDAKLLWAVGSIQAVKGVEIGPAFINATEPGSRVQDEIYRDEDGRLFRKTNNSGGFEGGITTGEPIVIRGAMKPISTILKGKRSVDLASGEEINTIYERSDFCAVPRAAVVGEAMVAFVLAQELIGKLGGDSLSEMRPRFQVLRKAELKDLPMQNQPWFFAYEDETQD